MKELLEEATGRALELARPMFPLALRPGHPHLLRVSAGLLARCVTTSEACLHLSALERRTDLMVAVRTLHEHTAMFAWLTGSPHGEHRMLLMQRANDQRALQIDRENVEMGGVSAIPEETLQQMADAAEALGSEKQPNLIDLVRQADSEWAARLARNGDDYRWSLRSLYTVIYRPASSMAHPSLAGIGLVIGKRPDGVVVVDIEPAGKGAEALQPVPPLLGMALLMSAHLYDRPAPAEIFEFAEWFGREWDAAQA